MLAPKVFILRFFLTLTLLQCAAFIYAQKSKQPIELTAGIELRTLVPISGFTMKPLNYSDSLLNAVGTYKGGVGFGGVIRFKLTDFWNLETGIYYTRRKFDFRVQDPVVNFDETIPMRIVGYEIPIKGLVYIQMGEKIYMNVALGVSTDFFASDTKIHRPSVSIGAFKRSWIKLAVLGNVGVEYRSEKDGYFYLGVTFHQPFTDIMGTQVNYFRDNMGKSYFQNHNIDGTYFSIDFRYFIPHKKEPTNKVKYSRPDWKNMK